LKRCEKRLDKVEEKLCVDVRSRVIQMAAENKEFVYENHRTSSDSVRTRLSAYRTMGQDLIDNIGSVTKARIALKEGQQSALNVDVLLLYPNADLQSLASGHMNVEQVLSGASSTARASEEVKELMKRNMDIQKMSFRIRELYELTQEMNVKPYKKFCIVLFIVLIILLAFVTVPVIIQVNRK